LIKQEVEMSTISFRIIVIGFLFLFTIISGLWLSNSGRPLNTIIFTIHKLIALAAVTFTAIVIHNLLNMIGTDNVTLILIMVTGLFVLTLFISGAFLSFEKPVNNILLTIHKVTPILTVISIAVIMYLLLNRQ
jgi:hypothetical protein